MTLYRKANYLPTYIQTTSPVMPLLIRSIPNKIKNIFYYYIYRILSQLKTEDIPIINLSKEKPEKEQINVK
jgi:hypothetical protein